MSGGDGKFKGFSVVTVKDHHVILRDKDGVYEDIDTTQDNKKISVNIIEDTGAQKDDKKSD